MNLSEKDELQQTIPEASITRAKSEVCRYFGESGVDLDAEFKAILESSEPGREFKIVDIGAGGSGSVLAFTRDLQSIAEAQELNTNVIAVAYDKNPLENEILGNVQEGDFEPEIIKGDAANMEEIPNNSISAGYSVACIQYVPDALRMLEESVRILKPGGKIFIYLRFQSDISLYPSLPNLIKETPGAGETFELIRSKDKFGGKTIAGIVCKKPKDSNFQGFPYKLRKTFNNVLAGLLTKARGFDQLRIYTKVPNTIRRDVHKGIDATLD